MSERTSRIFSGCRSSTYIIIFLQTSSTVFFCPCHRSSGAHSSFVEDDEDEDDDACCYRSAQEKLTDVLCCCLILFHLSFISFHFTPFLVAHQRFLLTLTGCFFCAFHSSLFLTPPTSPHTQFDTKIEQCRVYKHTNGEAKVSCFGCFLSSVQQHNSSNNRAKEAHNEFGMKLQEKRNYKFHFVKRHLI